MSINTSEKNVAEVLKDEIATRKSAEEPEAASCQDLDLSLNRVSPIHTNEVSIGKIPRTAISSLSKLIACDIASYISITDDHINLTFSFPKSDFSRMSLGVLQQLGTENSNKGENDVSKTLKSALTSSSDTRREANANLSGESLNRSFLSEIAYRCDMNNSEDILSAFMKESEVRNPENGSSECPKEFNSRQVSTFSNSVDHEREISKIDNSFEDSMQDSLKPSSKDASNTTIATPNGTLKSDNSRIESQEATSEVCIADAGNSKSDDSNMDVSVQMTPKPRKSLEVKVNPTRSLSIEFGCSTTDKENGNIPKRNNDLKDKMECHVPEYSTLKSKSETGVVKDNTGCDLTVCVAKSSPETGETNTTNKNSATNLQMTGVPNSQEISSTISKSGGIRIPAKSSLNNYLKTSPLRDYSERADEKDSSDGDNEQSGEHISTNRLKSDVWPEIIPFSKIYKIPAKEIESLVSTDSVIKYFQLELPGRCIVIKTVLEGVNDISIEIGEYKECYSCSSPSIEIRSERMGSLDVSSIPRMSDQDAELKMVPSNISEQPNEEVNGDEIFTPLLHETTRVKNEEKLAKIVLKIHTFRELETNIDSEDCNTLDKGELSNKCVPRQTSDVIRYTTEYPKKGNSNLERSNESIDVVSQHSEPPSDIDCPFKNQSLTELSSHELTETITGEVSCSTTTEDEPIRDESISSLSPTPNGKSFDVSTLQASVVDDVTATSSITSTGDSGNVTPSALEEEGIFPAAIVDEVPRPPAAVEDESALSPAVDDESVSISAAVDEEEAASHPTAIEDKAVPSTSETVEKENASTCDEIKDETLLSPPAAVEALSPTSAAVHEEAAPSPPAAIEDKAVPSTSGTLENEDASTCDEMKDETLLSPPAAVEADSPTSTAVAYDAETSLKVCDEAAKSPISPAAERSDTEADHLTGQSRNPSSPEGQSVEDEISAGPSAEYNEEITADNSSVTSTVEDPDTVDLPSSDGTSSSSLRWEEVFKNGIRSEDDSSKGTETSDETSGESKEIPPFTVERTKKKGGRPGTDTLMLASSSRAKPKLKDVGGSSFDEVDLAPTRARSRNPPSSLYAVPENSAVLKRVEKHPSRTSLNAARQNSSSQRNLRSKSLDPSPANTPAKSSSIKAVSGKPAPLENEAVVRVKRSENVSDRDAKSKVRSSPRKAKTSAILEETKSSGDHAFKVQSSNASFVNIRRSKRGAKE